MGIETMALLAATASVAGNVVQGVDDFATSRYNASVLNNQAAAARGDAGIAAQLALEDGARASGTATAVAAKNGGVSGSAFDVLADLNRQNIYEVRRLAVQGDNQGRALEADAKAAKRAGNFALGKSLIKAGAAAAGAPNGAGDGTLLSDFMERRQARGMTRRRSTAGSTSRIGGYAGGGVF